MNKDELLQLLNLQKSLLNVSADDVSAATTALRNAELFKNKKGLTSDPTVVRAFDDSVNTLVAAAPTDPAVAKRVATLHTDLIRKAAPAPAPAATTVAKTPVKATESSPYPVKQVQTPPVNPLARTAQPKLDTSVKK